MKKNSLLISILILFVIILGYALYSQYTSVRDIVFPPSPVQTPPSDTSRNVLIFPPPTASPEEKQRHINLVAQLAEESTLLEINSFCAMNPTVLKVGKNKNIPVKNSDTVDHTITFLDKEYLITPGESLTITLPELMGVHGYLCTPISGLGASGVFFFSE